MTDAQIMALWRECSIPTDANDHVTGPLPFARAVLALTSAPAEKADAFNRRLRAQLEQEWSTLQALKKAYQATQTPQAAGAIDAREQATTILRELEWSGSYYDSCGYGQASCPMCSRDKRDGHAKDCKLQAALASPQEAPPAPAAATALAQACDLLSMTIGTLMGAKQKIGYVDRSPIARLIAEAVEFLRPWPEKMPTALAATPAPEAPSSGAAVDHDPLVDFQEGQWWVAELDALARSDAATDDQKRAVAVVHNFLRGTAALKDTK